MEPLATDPFAAAILLAATSAGDPDASAAALDPALRERVDRVIAALSELRSRDRAAAMGALVAATAPHRADSPSPPRARAVLASLTTRETGARWLREAGSPRVGFRASGALRATLAHTEDDAWRA